MIYTVERYTGIIGMSYDNASCNVVDMMDSCVGNPNNFEITIEKQKLLLLYRVTVDTSSILKHCHVYLKST